MSFLSILKAIGLAIARFEGIIPLAEALYPAATPQLDLAKQVIDAVVQAESAAATLAQNGLSISGEQKMLMAVPQVAQALAAAFKALGHDVDPSKLTAQAQSLAQAAVDILNGIKAPVQP